MQQIKAIAKFKGENGSNGFDKDHYYTLTITQVNGETKIESKGGLKCVYSGAVTLLQNWDEINIIK